MSNERHTIGWCVKDFADGWIFFEDAGAAVKEAVETGAMIQECFSDGSVLTIDRVSAYGQKPND